jgi:hypothetical protein
VNKPTNEELIKMVERFEERVVLNAIEIKRIKRWLRRHPDYVKQK